MARKRIIVSAVAVACVVAAGYNFYKRIGFFGSDITALFQASAGEGCDQSTRGTSGSAAIAGQSDLIALTDNVMTSPFRGACASGITIPVITHGPKRADTPGGMVTITVTAPRIR